MQLAIKTQQSEHALCKYECFLWMVQSMAQHHTLSPRPNVLGGPGLTPRSDPEGAGHHASPAEFSLNEEPEGSKHQRLVSLNSGSPKGSPNTFASYQGGASKFCSTQRGFYCRLINWLFWCIAYFVLLLPRQLWNSSLLFIRDWAKSTRRGVSITTRHVIALGRTLLMGLLMVYILYVVLSSSLHSGRHGSPLVYRIIRYQSGEQYEGEINARSGRRDGHGTFYYSNGDEYTGTWKNDIQQGTGTYTFSTGELYAGDFNNGTREGRGKYVYNNQNVYTGEWYLDKREGFGILEYRGLGHTYAGEWKSDKRTGYGVYRLKNGSVYRGTFLNGSYHGLGRLERSNGETYSGNWNGGRMDGHGVYEFSTGGRYEGAFQSNKKHGLGVLILGDKDRYVGAFSEDRYHGQGVQKTKIGSYFGDFDEGVWSGFGEFKNTVNKTLFTGGFRQGHFHGTGRLKGIDGNQPTTFAVWDGGKVTKNLAHADVTNATEVAKSSRGVSKNALDSARQARLLVTEELARFEAVSRDHGEVRKLYEDTSDTDND